MSTLVPHLLNGLNVHKGQITHAAVALAARVGCLLVWVGEAGVRVYASGQPGGARADRLLYQARCALDETARLNVVREMYRLRADGWSQSRIAAQFGVQVGIGTCR